MKLKLILSVVFLLLTANPLMASVKHESYAKEIGEVEKFLNNINTFVASFTQISDDGGVSTGTFYLSRPGRLRWEYDDPTPLLIIAKGNLLTYYDRELDQVSHIGIDDTLAGFLTQDKIDFSKGVTLGSIEKKDGLLIVTVSQKDKEDEGALGLVFREDPMQLIRLEILDSVGKFTMVSFNGAVYGKPLDKSLFILPKFRNNDRR